MGLHANLEPVAGLVGRWRGPGRGEYPTITSFEFTEEVTFADVGKPFLTYLQRSWSPAGAPMHTESGFLRVPSDGTVELILAQPTGQAELAEGDLTTHDAHVEIELRSRVMNSASAKRVDATQRRFHLTGDELSVDFAMAAVGVPMTHHLASVLRRQA